MSIALDRVRVIQFTLCTIVVLGVAAAVFVQGSQQPPIETETVVSGVFEQSISVSGTVTPSKEIQLGFTSGGRVAAVSGGVGSLVNVGSVIASIDADDIRASIMQREAALANQEARLVSARQGARPEEIAVAQAGVDSATTALTQANSAVADAIRDAYVKADDAVRVQVAQFVASPKTANPKLNFESSNSQLAFDMLGALVASESTLAAWQADNALLSAQTDLTSSVAKAQASVTQIAALLAKASAVLSSAIPGGTVSQTSLDLYAADIAGARAAMSASTNAIQAAVTAQKNAAAAVETAKKNLTLKKVGPVASDIAAQEAQVRAAEADLANARALLSKTMIVAPFTGILTKMDAKVGLIAAPNTPLITMISAGAFQVESYIPEVNIGLVAVGNQARVTLDAYGESMPFTATVSSIDPAAVVRDGVATYRAVLQFTAADERIKPGMTANVVITTAMREGVISVPQGVITEREGRSYVRVRAGEMIIEREVQTGATSNLGRTEILAGLNAGDELVVSAPAE